jgi:hypothetical protein
MAVWISVPRTPPVLRLTSARNQVDSIPGVLRVLPAGLTVTGSERNRARRLSACQGITCASSRAVSAATGMPN